MTEILALLQAITPLSEKTIFRQMSQVIFGMLVASGRITMLGLSRWTEKGGSYRTIQRFYHSVISWKVIHWLFFRKCFLKPEDEYIVAGDEVVVSKAGKKTYGLDRFFSGIQQQVIAGLSFFTFSLVNVQEERSYPMQATQMVKSAEEKVASKAKAEAKKIEKTGEPKKRGRPKGSKNKDKQEVVLNSELLRIQRYCWQTQRSKIKAEAKMCLKIQLPWSMPAETERIGRKLLKENDVYRLIGDRLFEQLNEEEYADLYSVEGKPGISPIILAFISVFQYMEKLADRQAMTSLRMRLDWKYALHVPLDYEGFDFSVLSEFRDRLIKGQAEGRVFEKLVDQIQGMGLIKEHGKQRTDSIAMLTKVRRLCRVETVVETLRLAIVAIVDADREWSEEIIPPSWEGKYGERFVRQRYSEKDWKEYEENIGENGQWLLKRLENGSAPVELQDLPAVQVLKTVWAQQFREESGKMAYTDLKKYDGHTQIQSPHDPEARYSRKRHFEWVGDKVQVSETDDEGYPHIITDIVATSSNRTDYEELPVIQERLEKRACQPAEHYVDAGYMSGPNLSSSQKNDIDLIGPLANFVTPQDMLPNGITQSHFQIDAINNIVICPKGHVAKNPSPVNNSLSFRFPLKTCAACELRPRCCTGKGGRTIGISAYYDFTEAARARQKTEAFKKDYYQHRSGVEGTLSALVRGHGMRISRYIGHKKRNVQAIFTGCAANLKRASSWLAGHRPQIRYKQSWSLTPA